jgi:hypothetical protein
MVSYGSVFAPPLPVRIPNIETPVQPTQVPVPVLAQDNCVKYLGTPLTLFKATARLAAVTGTMVEFLECLEQLSSLPLHPAVKLYALKASLVPTLDYIVKCESMLGAKECQMIDQAVRSAVRKWLRLGRSCPNAYFYTRRRDGGLGIPCGEQRMQTGRLATMISMFKAKTSWFER